MSESGVIDLFLDDEDVGVGARRGELAREALGVGPGTEITHRHLEIRADVAHVHGNFGIFLAEPCGDGGRFGAGGTVAVEEDAHAVALQLGAAVGHDVAGEGVADLDGLVDDGGPVRPLVLMDEREDIDTQKRAVNRGLSRGGDADEQGGDQGQESMMTLRQKLRSSIRWKKPTKQSFREQRRERRSWKAN